MSRPGLKPELVRALGATYHSGSVLDLGFEPDVIVECTGVGSVIADSIQKIGAGGIVCLTGVGRGRVVRPAVADVAAEVVLKNNVLVGSVNANKRHWYKACQALAAADRAWLGRLITRREKPENFKQALREEARRHQGRHPVLGGLMPKLPCACDEDFHG